jgi:hypothetical protein
MKYFKGDASYKSLGTPDVANLTHIRKDSVLNTDQQATMETQAIGLQLQHLEKMPLLE